MVATDLQFVENAISGKHNKMRYAYNGKYLTLFFSNTYKNIKKQANYMFVIQK